MIYVPFHRLNFCFTLVFVLALGGCSAPAISDTGRDSFEYLFGSTQDSRARTVPKRKTETKTKNEKSGLGATLSSPITQAKNWFRKPANEPANEPEDTVVESENLRHKKTPAAESEEKTVAVKPVPEKSEKLQEMLAKDQWTLNAELQRVLDKASEAGEIPSKDNLVVGYNISGEAKKRNNFNQLNANPGSRRPQGEFIARSKEDADKGPISLRRWYHGLLEEEMLKTDHEELKIAAARILAKEDPNTVTGANAAILLAWLDVNEVRELLLESISSQEISVNQRAAAMEAFCSLPNTKDEELIKLYELFREKKTLEEGKTQAQLRPGVRELTIEVLQALAERRPPNTADCFFNALESADALIRYNAVRIWCDNPPEKYGNNRASGSLPETLTKLTRDPADSRIRVAAILALARWKHPSLDRYLYETCNDPQHNVRLATVDAMGLSESAQSLELLRENSRNTSSAIRARTARAFRKRGAFEDLFRMAEDKDAAVRSEVAMALQNSGDLRTRELMKQMLADRSVQVQKHALDALAAWPENQSCPILLEEMGSITSAKREKATQLLAQIWPPAAGYDYSEVRSEVRNASLKEFKERFYNEPRFADVDTTLLVDSRNDHRTRGGAVTSRRELDRISLEKGRRAFSLYQNPRATRDERNEAREQLLALEGKLALLIEYLQFHEKELIPTEIFVHLLPETNPEFAYLNDLDIGSLSERRSAAGKLLETSRQHPLGPLLASKLYEIVLHEEDTLTLITVMQIFEHNPGEIADAFALYSLESETPEIRRRACEQLAHSDNVAVISDLLPMLNDTSSEIVRTTLQSLSRLAEPYFAEESDANSRVDIQSKSIKPRRSLARLSREEQREVRLVCDAIHPTLLRSEIHLQLEAAIALCSWQDESGLEALQRLSYSPEHRVRVSVANGIARSREARLAEVLIMLLDDENGSVRAAALQALPKLLEVDHGNPTGTISVPLPERIRNWKRWFESENTAATSIHR